MNSLLEKIINYKNEKMLMSSRKRNVNSILAAWNGIQMPPPDTETKTDTFLLFDKKGKPLRGRYLLAMSRKNDPNSDPSAFYAYLEQVDEIHNSDATRIGELDLRLHKEEDFVIARSQIDISNLYEGNGLGRALLMLKGAVVEKLHQQFFPTVTMHDVIADNAHRPTGSLSKRKGWTSAMAIALGYKQSSDSRFAFLHKLIFVKTYPPLKATSTTL